ncbi:MAG: secretin N-terminal domain-containing protein [Desulfobacterales bacterium]|jgi:type II secretory pathway component GspD/PulD (secretin)
MSRHFFIIFIILNLTFVLYGLSIAQKAKTVGGRMVVCVVQLEHADAEYLASILEPFLSPEGSIVPYVTTNAIIIKDRQPVVDMLTKLIKGKPCSPISQSSGAKMRDK